MSPWSSSDALISPCEQYRYRLERGMGEGKIGLWIGVNPSTADAVENDHSIRKLFGFGKRLGIGHWYVGNLFAYRSTDIRGLARASDPVGVCNDIHLAEMMGRADLVIAGWGSLSKIPPRLRYRAEEIRIMAERLHVPLWCWGFTKSGDPLHPLMLAYDTPLREWNSQ